MERPVIKKIDHEELEACAELIRESFATVAHDFHLTRENCPTNGAFIDRSHLESDWNKGNFMFGLYCGQDLTGFVELEKKTPDICELKKLAVRPHDRHLGYGAALLDFACQIAKNTSASKITFGMIEENTVLKRWYQSNGFVHTCIKKFAHLPFTVGFMEKAI